MSQSSTQPRYGVRSTLENAPAEPHQVPGLHVLVTPGQTTPLETQADVERARALAEAGADIEVVDLPKTKPAKAAGEKE